MMKKDLLVTLADKNYINQAKALFSSVYWNAGWKGDYMLLSHGIPEKELKWFRDKGILIKKCKPLYNKPVGVKEVRHSVVTSKFYLFTSEFKKWKNIVFLEGDIIVKASLDKLTRLKGFYATDVFDRAKLHNQITDSNKKLYNQIKEKYDLSKLTFNTGVMVFSSDIVWDDSFDGLNKLFIKYKNISKYGEEGIINLFLYGKWKKLPIVYNIWNYSITDSCKINIKKIRGIILHFISSLNLPDQKPWDKNNPFYYEWKKNLERAEFIDLNKMQKAKRWVGLKIQEYELYLNLIPSNII